MTDTLDESLYTDGSEYLANQYMVRNDLLICPIMEPQSWSNGNRQLGQREVYLPQPNKWYDFNLRTMQNGEIGKPLQPSRDGGQTIMWDGSISNKEDHIPYITPMFIRAGNVKCYQCFKTMLIP